MAKLGTTDRVKFLTKVGFINVRKWLHQRQVIALDELKNNSFIFIGHATLAFNFNGVKIITDPVLYNHLKGVRKTDRLARESIDYGYDYVLITHAHSDHLHKPSLRLLNKKATVIMPVGTTKYIKNIGFKQTKALRANAPEYLNDDLKITAFRCNHDGRRFYRGERVDTLSYLVETPQIKVFIAGDTALTNNFDGIKADVAFMPIGCYQPVAMESMHCNPEQSYEMFARMQAKYFVPIHFGTLNLALDNDLLTVERIMSLSYDDPRIKLVDIGRRVSFAKMKR